MSRPRLWLIVGAGGHGERRGRGHRRSRRARRPVRRPDGSAPRATAPLRNFAIGAIRLFGRNDIIETTRWAHRGMRRPFQILDSAT
jgi:hypothetical protein